MAREKTPEENAADNERKQLVEEKKNLKKEQQAQRKEAKRRAREIAKQEDELEDGNEGNSLLTFGATILIVALWLAVICVIIKLDIGGFGSSVVTPILKDVPVLNRILPGNSVTETTNSGAYGGYTSLQDAVDQIKSLELQLEQIQNASSAKDEELDQLKAEVLRLKEFENQQVEFQRIQKEFYDEVVYSDKGPGAEEYKKYYESMDPATAEYIYKQVVTQLQESQEVQDYAAAYSAMKPKQAAAIFEQMTNNLDLAAPLLEKYGFCANIAVIGVSIGRTTYKDTDIPITPHFSLKDAHPWVARGVLTVTTHSYDMHQVTAVDGAGCRRGVLQMPGEAEPDYIAALTQDYTRAQEQLAGLPGTPLPVFTYPNGAYSELSERVLQALGVQVTVTTEGGANRLVKGEPETLRLLHRIHVWRGTKPDMLLSRIDSALQALR